MTVGVMTSMAILPLLFGCVGIFSLFKLLQCVRTKASLQDAVVVVTGATSGLGRGGSWRQCLQGEESHPVLGEQLSYSGTTTQVQISEAECAKVFYAAGAKLVLCGRNREALEELTKELTASQATKVQTHKPFTVTFDLTDPEAVVGATAEILQCFGYVDVLINNAGVSYRGAILDTTTDVDKRVMETNYFGPVALTKDAASKHATQAFFDCLRAEMEQYEIKVTIISPGYIHTNLSLNAITADGSRYGVMDKTTAQGRMPMEVARDVLTAVVKKKKDVILADLLPSLAVYLRTLAPGLFFSLMAYRARREQKSKNS
ncbi:dehydrogenase/reductase SDR family member 7B isoform X2 [Phyllostomus hastatus]|uniref:dehydrogenase/reductase SDR family member 7B isoform X2 n=1 Tax=Phyllostomus hastatus TaxID=9423 RepID=UPI001E67F2CF|nr:dehydrogenase/reductase SDR family member 7B isoform X2 [Phyllostomus hastatus]